MSFVNGRMEPTCGRQVVLERRHEGRALGTQRGWNPDAAQPSHRIFRRSLCIGRGAAVPSSVLIECGRNGLDVRVVLFSTCGADDRAYRPQLRCVLGGLKYMGLWRQTFRLTQICSTSQRLHQVIVMILEGLGDAEAEQQLAGVVTRGRAIPNLNGSPPLVG
jgi:hypothetical protein